MAISSITTNLTGEIGVSPRIVRINSTDSFATVTTAGYLNQLQNQGYTFYPNDIVALTYGDNISQFFTLSISSGVITLEPTGGDVVLPVTSGHIAVFSGTAGNIGDDATTAINGGNIQAGLSGTAGYLASFPSAASKGSLRVQGVANTGDTVATISNAEMGQASVISIPDPGTSTANFLLDTGTANILTDNQLFIGINEILIASVGTWTRTRIAQGNYVLRHTAADDTSIIGIDITEALRTTASKGFRLASIDVIYSIATLALDAHTLTLDRITYANNVAVSVNSVALTGALATATQANPYVTNVTVDTPAFLNTADSKYVLELTVDAAATSDYDFYGLVLRFSETVA